MKNIPAMPTIIFTLLFTAILLSSCSPKETETINIGAILFLTNNDVSSIAEAMQQGIDIAAEELNANGGILDKKIRIIYEDDQMNQREAVTAAHKLVGSYKSQEVSAGLIGLVNTVKGAGKIFQEEKVPLMVLWDSNKELEKMGDYIYSIGYNTEDAGMKMADHLYKKGARKVAVIKHNDEWSLLISNSFSGKFRELGGEITVDQASDPSEIDYRTLILKAKDSDAIYAPIVNAFGDFFRQTKELGYKGIVSVGDGVNMDIIDSAKGAAEGIYFSDLVVEDKERLNKLGAKYQEKYRKEPELLVFTALGYDGIMVIAEAIKIAGTGEPEAIAKALYKVQGYQGAAGNVNMKPSGMADKYEEIFMVQDGELVPAE